MTWMMWMALAWGQQVEMPSGSMAPTLCAGQTVAYEQGPATRGAVVVFPYPRAPERTFVKRVIGTAGDTVAFRDGVPVVDGTPIAREPVGKGEIRDDLYTREVELLVETVGGARWTIAESTGAHSPLANTEPVVVPEGMVYVVGDNRDRSEDSRRWGFVPVDTILGIAKIEEGTPPCVTRTP